MILPSQTPDILATSVVRYAQSTIPTDHGEVRFLVYREARAARHEHVALLFDPVGTEDVLVRVHSECVTSEVFGSLKCDCKLQLDTAMTEMAKSGGALIYLRQEGRGIGLGNKIRAYELQNGGADTVQANHQLGFETDLRTYDVAAAMLHDLKIRSVRLLTNNPEKIQGLENYGIAVSERLPICVEVNEHSADYVETKQVKLGHLL